MGHSVKSRARLVTVFDEGRDVGQSCPIHAACNVIYYIQQGSPAGQVHDITVHALYLGTLMPLVDLATLEAARNSSGRSSAEIEIDYFLMIEDGRL